LENRFTEIWGSKNIEDFPIKPLNHVEPFIKDKISKLVSDKISTLSKTFYRTINRNRVKDSRFKKFFLKERFFNKKLRSKSFLKKNKLRTKARKKKKSLKV
jgi:hypothetical protein